MRRFIVLLLLVLSFHSRAYSQKEKAVIEAAISQFFDGLSEIDPVKLKANSTSDFMLLENGEVWSLDTLISRVSARKNSGIKRVNSFQFILVEQNGKIAWVSYHNTANFSLNEKKQTMKWLESAVLIKEKEKWRIKLLHSTRIAAHKPAS